ncbi:MAG: gluconate 2-dehydrogenase subunit 3 family protein [Persicimonas sp.]
MNRRDFLKWAGAGSAAAAVGSVVFRTTQWWNQPPGAHWRVLSAEEAAIVAAIVDALFPGDIGRPPLPNGVEAGVVEAFDDYLAGTDAVAADGLRLLVHAIDEMAMLRDFGLTRFRDRSRSERIAILEAWDESSLTVRRASFRGLKYALSTQYCTQPSVQSAVGIVHKCGGS